MSIRVNDDWLLTPQRLAIHVPTATAVIADVHLGYREARQQAGEAIPLLSVREQLALLMQARKQFGFDKLLVAGDLFERNVRQDLLDDFLAELQSLDVKCTGLIPGNHDRGWESFAKQVPMFPDGVALGGWHIVHGDAAVHHDRLVLGHWHPIVQHLNRRLPCYLVGPQRIILPAFSADAAGGAAHKHVPSANLRRYAIVGDTVKDLGLATAHSATKNPRRGGRGFRSRTG